MRLCHKKNFLISISLHPDVLILDIIKRRLFDPTEFKVSKVYDTRLQRYRDYNLSGKNLVPLSYQKKFNSLRPFKSSQLWSHSLRIKNQLHDTVVSEYIPIIKATFLFKF